MWLFRGCLPLVKSLVYRYTALTVWAATRCWTGGLWSRSGLHLQESIAEQGALRDASESDVEASLDRLNRWNNNRNGEDPVAIRKALQECMQHNFSVFREGDAMAKGLEQLKVIRERLKNARLDDTSSEFNTQRVECTELDNLMETAYATAVSANFRTESRGAHSRFDFPDRDDENWLCHSCICLSRNP